MNDQSRQVENLILGGGEAGKYIAWELAGAGRETVVVERGLIGGSCPNIACLPSKNMIRSAKVAHLLRHAGDYGMRATNGDSDYVTDMVGVRGRKRDMVDALVAIHRKKFGANGLEFVEGEGRFVAPHTIEVSIGDGSAVSFFAERIFLDLGTHARIPDVPGLAASNPLTHVEALELDRLPAHLIVLGGGYVGVEAAQAFRRFGSRVTVIEHGLQLMSREDRDVGEAVRAIFEAEGIEVILGAETLGVNGTSSERVQLHISTPAGAQDIEGTDVLAATGRTPNTRGIGLEAAGIELDSRGYIKTNERLETTAAAIWAMGECAGSPQFTHIALDDFRVVRDNLAGRPRTTRDRLVPYCAFIDPELARIGLDEKQARERGIATRIVRLPMTSVLRARTLGEMEGFMKALIDKDSDAILGFTMLGPHAGEVLAVVQTAMLAGAPYTALREAIFTHPTMAEGLNVLFDSTPE